MPQRLLGKALVCGFSLASCVEGFGVRLFNSRASSALSVSSDTIRAPSIERIPIDEEFRGIKRIHSDPDIFLFENFLSKDSCEDIIRAAAEKKMDQSPVAYAGITEDFKELLSLSAKGPAAWLAIGIAWYQAQSEGLNQMQLLSHLVQNYIVGLLLAAGAIRLFLQSKTENLQTLRTSTSTTLDNLDDTSSGVYQYVKAAADMFEPNEENKSKPAQQAKYFECPTIIRYEPGQVLAPHYDANRAADVEDANRGGQTLATLILYLNNVEKGGKTRFGSLDLDVSPVAGDALLFFPSSKDGDFDDRLEHEGQEAIDPKWIARIWYHIDRVNPPFGLSVNALSKL
jgi:hypothetical protein